ncbi:MAG: phage tail protein, partial [Planctomycetota bacterium JB042]
MGFLSGGGGGGSLFGDIPLLGSFFGGDGDEQGSINEIAKDKIPEGKLLATSEGAPMNFVMGDDRIRVPLVVFYAEKATVHKKTVKGEGKGAPSTSFETLEIDCAYSMGSAYDPNPSDGKSGHGRIEGFRRIWLAGKIVYHSASPSKGKKHYDSLKLTRAGDTASAPEIITDEKGVNNVPAFRGQNFFEVENLKMTESFGGGFPQKGEALVKPNVGPFTIADAITALWRFADVSTSLLDVSEVTGQNTVSSGTVGQVRGYFRTGYHNVAQALRELLFVYDVTAQEEGGVVRFLDRGYEDIVEVDWQDLGVLSGNTGKPIRFYDDPDAQTPGEVTFAFQSQKNKWQRTTRTARRFGTPYDQKVEIGVNINLEPKEGMRVARRRLWGPTIESRVAVWSLPQSYNHLQAADIMAVAFPATAPVFAGQRFYIRVLDRTVGNDWQYEFRGTLLYTQSADDDLLPDLSNIFTFEEEEEEEDSDVGEVDDEDEELEDPPAKIHPILADIPPLRFTATEVDQPGHYFAHAVEDVAEEFTGSVFYKAKSNVDSKYKATSIAMPPEGIVGFADTVLPAATVAAFTGAIDTNGTVDVTVYEGTLGSATLEDVLASETPVNWALLGTEIIAFRDLE